MAKKKLNLPLKGIGKVALIGGAAYVGLRAMSGNKQANGASGGGMFGPAIGDEGFMAGLTDYLNDIWGTLEGIDTDIQDRIDPTLNYLYTQGQDALTAAEGASAQAVTSMYAATAAGTAAAAGGAYTIYKTRQIQRQVASTPVETTSTTPRTTTTTRTPTTSTNPYYSAPRTTTVVDAVPVPSTRTATSWMDYLRTGARLA